MTLLLGSRRCLFMLTMGVASVAVFTPASGQEQAIRTQTFTYKTVGNLEIKADVHRADDDTVRPVVVWIHGGALIMGNRSGLNRVTTMMLSAGYAVVSIDYRLAPETRLPAIIEDLEDAFTWVRTEGPALFDIEPSRIAVIGASAGGYLTLTSGFRAQPRPTVLVSFFGYGDLVGDWYSQPSHHARHNRVRITEDEAQLQMGGPPVSDSRDRVGDGGLLYNYSRQQGTWPEVVSGWDPHTEAEKFYPFMPVQNMTQDYPPTMLIHGTSDTDVPYEQSVMMAEQFNRHGVPHELVTIPGAEHGLADGDPQLIDRAYDDALAWINLYMQ